MLLTWSLSYPDLFLNWDQFSIFWHLHWGRTKGKDQTQRPSFCNLLTAWVTHFVGRGAWDFWMQWQVWFICLRYWAVASSVQTFDWGSQTGLLATKRTHAFIWSFKRCDIIFKFQKNSERPYFHQLLFLFLTWSSIPLKDESCIFKLFH